MTFSSNTRAGASGPKQRTSRSSWVGDRMIRDFFYETWYLGLRTLRRFFRVPANWIGIILFPLIQLFVFSQLFKDIIQLPGFRSSGSGSYLAYLAPGQIGRASCRERV